MSTPSPTFPPWLAPLVVIVLLALVSYLVVTGADVPAWLIGLLVSAVGVVLGIDAGLVKRRGNGGGD